MDKLFILQNDKPAPPVLEPESTKISYNIRMQYYNMMVKHCLIIYPNCEDAWDRVCFFILTGLDLYRFIIILEINYRHKRRS